MLSLPAHAGPYEIVAPAGAGNGDPSAREPESPSRAARTLGELRKRCLAPASPVRDFFMVWFFLLFFISGFCSILYEIVWLRLAMAQFGVTSALTSIVLSMFMAGLGLGSWGAGRLIRIYEENREEGLGISALRVYALAELLIGISALLVPYQFWSGRQLLQRLAVSSSWSYYLGSGVCVALTLIPWCACMGATIPLAMRAIRKWRSAGSERSFSYLYLANVLGAVVGSTVPLLLIELYGFHGTLKVGAFCNTALAVAAIILSAVLARSSQSPSSRRCG